MMELSHSLTLNEDALRQLPESKRPVFIFEWLRFLDKVLIAAQKSDIKGCQQQLVSQLMTLVQESPGPPTRRLVARCLATLFSVGDTFLLFDTVNKCNDIIRNRDDSPSFLPNKLGAICCIGAMYEKLGRMMGRSYEETVQILIKSLRSAESQTRIEIMSTLEKVCSGMGTAIANVHKEIYKAARQALSDRVMAVRCAASKCILQLVSYAGFLVVTELDGLASLCLRSLDGSSYEVRCSVARLLGVLVAATQQQPTGSTQTKATKTLSLEEALTLLMSGFLRGGIGFLKTRTGEMIKGGSGLNREVRVGVTHAYVVFIQLMGSGWLERNLSTILTHVLDLVANPKTASSHVDAVYARKCVNFILRSVLGRMLPEKAQIAAVKELTLIVAKQMASIDFSPENAKDCNQETLYGQHLLVCALQEMACLVERLGTTASNLLTSTNMIETVMAVSVHPCQAARLAAAWCLRCVCVAVPSHNSPVVDRCVEHIENMRSSPEVIAGYSAALAAVLGGVRLCPLGIPHTKGKVIFNTAEELLRSASQNSRLSLNRTSAGWILIGAIMALGVPVVRGLLPRMLLLWRNSFPRSNKELESEKARGDAFTWQVTLEGRAGALSTMHSFLLHCPELVTDDIIRRLLTPIDAALAMLTNISSVLKNYGQHLKAPAAMVRLRLYETLCLLPPQSFESSYTHLLRLLVAEFTLSENSANTTTSQLRSACHREDSVILGTWLQETDHRTIEEQLQPTSAAGSGALEHDACCLYRPLPQGESMPGPLPLGVAVIDSSVKLFGCVFPRVANKHRLQMLEHFGECMRTAKSCRMDAVNLNVFAALLAGLRGLTDTKTIIGQEDVKNNTTALIMGAVISGNGLLRCAAAECLGRLAQVVGDPRFTAKLAQTSFDQLKLARDAASRTGHSLALGCLHRHVGSMGSTQHLNTSVSILLALAQDLSSPLVQVWALDALALIAESGGPMLRGYVEPTLSLALKLLLNVCFYNVDVHQCIGKLVSALITTVGPELQGNTVSVSLSRSSFLCACAIMQDHQEPLVQAEAISCLQQLHLFAPRHVNLSSLVSTLCNTLASNHLLLRKAAVSCLRQLTQREAKEVCEHALGLAVESNSAEVAALGMTDTGLPGVLFGMLDSETDPKLISDLHDTLTSMLTVLAADHLAQWLALCRLVLTDTTLTGETENSPGDEEVDDDRAEFTMGEKEGGAASRQPCWPTRVFAAACLRRIIDACTDLPHHFDLASAKQMQFTNSRGDWLVLHLADLVRMAFIAATSDCDPLRLQGLLTLQQIIEKFAKVPEPEFPGHLLLEQFQAQVGAALRPAFSAETASHVTAAACQVCSAWIGSGVARDLNDLRRVHQLLVSSLAKLQRVSDSPYIYNESLATLERLSILKAWAEVYIVAMANTVGSLTRASKEGAGEFGQFESSGESLLSLVQPELVSLSHHWLAALKDHALLSLPPEFTSQLPHDGGAFYTTDTMDSCRPHYAAAWPPLLHAAALWLNANNFDSDDQSSNNQFHLLFGICMEALCNPRVSESSDNTSTCLKALSTLFETAEPCEMLMENKALAIELCNVLHRILLMTTDSLETQQIVLDVLKKVLQAAQNHLDKTKKQALLERVPANKDSEVQEEDMDLLGEGGAGGELPTESSLVFAALEVCLCCLVSQMPSLSPSPIPSRGPVCQVDHSGVLVGSALALLERLPALCSPKGALAVMPTVLYLATAVLQESSMFRTSTDSPEVRGSLHCLEAVCGDRYGQDKRTAARWCTLLQSALAKVIDLTKGIDEARPDEASMLLAIGIFVLHAPPQVVLTPDLKYPCINHMAQCAQSDNIQVQVKCMQIVKRVVSECAPSVSVGFIHALAPQVLHYLHGTVARQPTSQPQLMLTVECVAFVDALVSLAEPKHRVQMLSLLVPILVDYLHDSDTTTNTFCRALHQHCLQTLQQIGPQYPQEFKAVMNQSAELRTRLEGAIRSSQVTRQPTTAAPINTHKAPLATPTIKLKTDFRNFS